jgi:acyl-coenzyme A thioesterase PaaI-like protein
MIDTLREILAGPAAAPFVKNLGLQVVGASPDEVTLSLPVVPHLVYGEGSLCGQAIMAAKDFAMVLAVVANAGGKYRPMTTVQLFAGCLPMPARSSWWRVCCARARDSHSENSC